MSDGGAGVHFRGHPPFSYPRRLTFTKGFCSVRVVRHTDPEGGTQVSDEQNMSERLSTLASEYVAAEARALVALDALMAEVAKLSATPEPQLIRADAEDGAAVAFTCDDCGARFDTHSGAIAHFTSLRHDLRMRSL